MESTYIFCALDTEARRILLFEAIYTNLHLSKIVSIFIIFASNMLQARREEGGMKGKTQRED